MTFVTYDPTALAKLKQFVQDSLPSSLNAFLAYLENARSISHNDLKYLYSGCMWDTGAFACSSCRYYINEGERNDNVICRMREAIDKLYQLSLADKHVVALNLLVEIESRDEQDGE